MRLTTKSAVLVLSTALTMAFGTTGFAQQSPQQPVQNGAACTSGAGQNGCSPSKPSAQKGSSQQQGGQKATAPKQGGQTRSDRQGANKGTAAQSGHRQQTQKGQEQTRRASDQGPRIGESARRAPQLQQARDSRLPAPPQGQHYRVMDDRVVRVDDSTQKIVAIIGLASQLLGQ